jgi:ABC-type multidrug transport system ATPase subunit
MVKLLTTMFGLQKQVDTVRHDVPVASSNHPQLVGNEFLRGLSGGERKRLTLMEAMVTAASITCWDCGTRGELSSSSFS